MNLICTTAFNLASENAPIVGAFFQPGSHHNSAVKLKQPTSPILDTLQTAVLLIDSSLCVQYMNAAAEQLFEMSFVRTSGQPLAMLTLLDDVIGRQSELVLQNSSSRTIREVEVLTRARVTPQTVDCMLTAYSEAGQRYVLIEFNPVDRMTKMIREGWLEERQQTNHVVIRGLAHEIKNPLGGIRGAAQLLEQELEFPALREYTDLIIRETDRLTNLVSRMQATTRVVEPGAVNIHEVLEHVRKLLLTEHPHWLEFELDYDPSLPAIKAEREPLIQAVMNIAGNAVQAVDAEGMIRLRTRIDRRLVGELPRYRQVVRVDIIDNGPGIPESIADQIFDPMVTGRSAGTGLGLSISADIIRQYGGQIEAESSAEGTCFSLYLLIA